MSGAGGVGSDGAIVGGGADPAPPGAARPDDLLRVDLHAHTRFSEDGVMSPAELMDRARIAGMDRITISDHGTIEGALADPHPPPEGTGRGASASSG